MQPKVSNILGAKATQHEAFEKKVCVASSQGMNHFMGKENRAWNARIFDAVHLGSCRGIGGQRRLRDKPKQLGVGQLPSIHRILCQVTFS